MADPAHEAADRTIEGLRREFERVYRQAEKEARRALERHLEKFAEEDARMAERVEKGELSEEDYRRWREVKMLNGDSYRALVDQAARGYADAGAYASAAVDGRLPEVYAENVNYGTYQVESAARVDTAFALQDADTVQRLVTDRSSYLPRVSHDVAKDALWNRKLLADQITQGVMLGESIPKIAARVARVTGQNVAGAARVARTSVTAAECAGRVDSYRRAKSMGIDLKQEWLATLDTRTRRSHRKLDGEKVDVGSTFSNGCRYPGDPQAPYGEICNCRCTLIAAVEGVDYSDGKRWSRLPGGMTYDDWKAGKDLDEAEWTKGGKGKPGKKGGTAGSKGKVDGKQAAPISAPSRVIASHDTANAAAEALRASLSRGEALGAQAVRAVVGKMAPLGPAKGRSAADYLDLTGLPAHNARMLERAARYVPTSMLDTIRAGGVKVVYVRGLKRSDFDPATNAIRIARGTDELVAVHEMMHAVEEHDPAFLQAERKYFEKRTKGKQLVQLRRLTGNASYGSFEVAYDVGRSCIDPYTFKDYGGNGYELMSMGVETLYRSPLTYARDPEMLKWVMDMLERFG